MAGNRAYKADVFKKTIRYNIRKKLREVGWTHAKLAVEAGVSPGMVSKWLNGDSTPGLTGLAKVCTALGEGPEYFLTTAVDRKDAEVWFKKICDEISDAKLERVTKQSNDEWLSDVNNQVALNETKARMAKELAYQKRRTDEVFDDLKEHAKMKKEKGL